MRVLSRYLEFSITGSLSIFTVITFIIRCKIIRAVNLTYRMCHCHDIGFVSMTIIAGAPSCLTITNIVHSIVSIKDVSLSSYSTLNSISPIVYAKTFQLLRISIPVGDDITLRLMLLCVSYIDEFELRWNWTMVQSLI